MVEDYREPQALNSSELSDGLGRARIEEATDIEWLKKTVADLFQLLDDIDTAGDMAKSDDKLYRAIVERTQKRRWECGITSDGYSLFTP